MVANPALFQFTPPANFSVKKSANFEYLQNQYSGIFRDAASEYVIRFSIWSIYEAFNQDYVNFTKNPKSDIRAGTYPFLSRRF